MVICHLVASWAVSWRAKLCGLPCVFFVFRFSRKSCQKWFLQESYSNLPLGHLMGRLLAGKIMEAVLCIFHFPFFQKKLPKLVFARIV